jgi:flagellar biosynthesis component FlhA
MLDELTLPPEGKVIEPRERSALLAALRSLLVEGAPIVLKDIVAAWPQVRATYPHLRAQVEALRSLPSIRHRLPGNDGKHQLFEIGPKFESELRRNLYDPEGVPLLSLVPDRCQEMLAEVRNELPSDRRAAPAAIVVNDGPLRPHLRDLTKLEWPSVPVLALTELRDDVMTSPRSRIELE